MSKLIIVIPFHVGDAPMAERLCGLIYGLNGRAKSGHCLLVSDPNVHDEMVVKAKIASEVAFSSVDHIAWQMKQSNIKPERINRAFISAAEHIQGTYQWPWLWLEPDCVPLREGWAETLSRAYENQPKRYLGPFLKYKAGNTEASCLSRVAVYPSGAFNDLDRFCDGQFPFQRSSGHKIIPMATKTLLIQHAAYDPNSMKIREDAVLFHSDKSGQLLQKTLESVRKPLEHGSVVVPIRRKVKAETD